MGVYWDNSSKGQDKNMTKTKYHNCWRAEKMVKGVRFRKRFKNYNDAKLWIENFNYDKEIEAKIKQ